MPAGSAPGLLSPGATGERYLDGFETQLAQGSPTHVMRYRGKIDAAALGRAFGLLRGRYAALRAVIREDPAGLVLYVPGDAHGGLEVLGGGSEAVDDIAHLPWDAARHAARLWLVHGEHVDEGFVVLRATYAIADGTARTAWLTELWWIYAAIADGVNVTLGEEVPLPGSCIERLTRAGVGIAPVLRTPGAVLPVQYSPAVERNVWLDPAATGRLVAAARRLGTSVHALFCGAALIAQRALDPTPGPAEMACMSAVDLRHRVEPSVGPTETTFFDIRHKTLVSVPDDGDAVALGREVKARLDSDLASGRLVLEPVRSPPEQVDTVLEQRLATVWVSNSGAIPPIAAPAGLEITDVFVQRSGSIVLYPTYSLRTYGGRLNIRFDFPAALFSDQEVDQVVTRTETALAAFGA